MVPHMRAIILVLLLTLPVLAGATDYVGKVISVHDGDTIRVLYRDGELKAAWSASTCRS